MTYILHITIPEDHIPEDPKGTTTVDILEAYCKAKGLECAKEEKP